MSVRPLGEGTGALSSLFWSHRPDGATGVEDLEAVLGEALARGHRAWPEVKLEAGTFIPHLSARLPAGDGDGAELATRIGLLRVEDLYLACACVSRDRLALEALEKQFLARLQLRRTPLSGNRLDELRSLLRERLLLPTGQSPPRLERYSGQGPLLAWLQVVAVRLAFNLARDEKRDQVSEEAMLVQAGVFAPAVDPEIDFLKRRHQEDFSVAFREAMQELTVRERYLLRLHLCDRLNIDRIAALEGVHRATAARWLSAARQRLHEQTLQRLQLRISGSTTELESLIRLVRSQLDVSVNQYLSSSES